MNKVGAIICELNPFHMGHKHLLDSAKSYGITHIVGIMSANFIQRGEPAILSKEVRAEIALSNGFDIILEIPSIWAMSVAEKFALAGVSIAENLGCVDNLIFGSECGNLSILDKISEFMLSGQANDSVKLYLNKGYSFALSTELSVKDFLGEEYAKIIQNPNNILAIEYLKALKKLNSSIKPVTVKRIGANHDLKYPLENICSSSYLRKCIKEGNNNWYDYVPHGCRKIISEQISESFVPVSLDSLDLAILYKLRYMSKSDFSLIPDISEGLENRILKLASSAVSLEDLISKVSTKRYTKSRIKRIIMCAFLGILKSDQTLHLPYIKLLGSNKKGMEILKLSKKLTNLPIISRYRDYKKLDNQGQLIFQKEQRIDSVYNLMSPKILSSSYSNKKKFILGRDDL